MSETLPETGPGALTANDVTGPVTDEMAGRGDDEQIEDLVDADPDVTDPDAAPGTDEVGSNTERSGAEVIGLDDDVAEGDAREIVIGPGTDDDRAGRPAEDDLSDGEFEDGSDQVQLYEDDDSVGDDLSEDAAIAATDPRAGTRT